MTGPILGILAGVATLVGVWAACEHEKHKENMAGLAVDKPAKPLWTIDPDEPGVQFCIRCGRVPVADTWSRESAETIVQACNAHDDLLAAAKGVLDDTAGRAFGAQEILTRNKLRATIARAEGSTTKEGLASAALVAAAPDLLAVARRMRARLAAMVPSNPDGSYKWVNDEADAAMLDNAIAKAEAKT